MQYKIELIHSEEGYSVGCPELPGCWTEGATEEEAIQNVRDAIQDYLAVQPKDRTPKTIRFVDVPDTSADVMQAKPFVVKPFAMGLPPGGSYDNVEDLLDQLDGPNRR